MSALQMIMKNRCRICLDTDGEKVLLNTKVDIDEQEMMISDMLTTCTGLHIHVDDEKPQGICLRCSAKTYELYQFRVISIKSDLILQNELDSQNGFNEQDNKLDLHRDLNLVIEEDKDNTITHDNTNGTLVSIKDELPDCDSISYNANFKFEQNTGSMEEIICKICQTYIPNWISLEHHLEDCCRRVSGDNGQAACSSDEHTLTHEAPSIDKKVGIVILKQQRMKHKCRLCKMSYKFAAELRYHMMTHITVKRYLCSYCGNNFSLSDRSICERTLIRHDLKHTNRKKGSKTSELGRTLLRFGCAVCKQSYRSKKSFSNHKCINISKKPHKCSQSSKEYAFGSKLGERACTLGKPYECSYCSKRFSRQFNLITHERIHTGEKRYQCFHCCKPFARQHDLTKHERIHTGEKPYACSYCSKRFAQKISLTKHELIHTGEKPYDCSYCSKRFTQRGSVINHERTHTGEKPFQCSDCDKQFTLIHHLNSHKLTHTGEKPYECSLCSKRFTDERTLNRHKRTHTGEKPYVCSQCSKRFGQKGALTTHERIHTGEKPYACLYCSKCFGRRGDLTKHERIHTGEKPYHCSYCSKRFSDKSQFARHERTHTDDKPYQCSHCSKRFVRRDDHTKHERIHTGEKPYHCSYCIKRFSDKSQFIRHERTHTGENPYHCSHCSKSFALIDDLLQHQRIHTTGKPYEFIDCINTLKQEII